MFLYYLVSGVVVRSYGLNVVCLVGILREIFNLVVEKLNEFESVVFLRWYVVIFSLFFYSLSYFLILILWFKCLFVYLEIGKGVFLLFVIGFSIIVIIFMICYFYYYYCYC